MREWNWTLTFLILMLLLCSLDDFVSHRIPNRYILIAFLVDLMHQFSQYSIKGIFLAAATTVSIVLLLKPIYLLHGLGGGDIKLLAVVAAYTGIRKFPECFFFILLLSVFYAFIRWLVGRRRQKFRFVCVPMAVPIFTGVLLMTGGGYL